VRIDGVRRWELVERVVQAARRHARMTVLYVNAHCMNLQARDDAYRDILAEADTVYCDGMGVLLAARLTGQQIPERMTGADWIEDLCRAASRHDLSLYLLGATPDVVQGAAVALRTRYPGLRIVGASDGYDVGPGTIAEINRSRPDILLVGMGPPRQEKWIARHRSALHVPVVWAVGGLFDVVSGRVPRGPRWMTQHGLEWMCRLVVEPRRLWRRYLLGNPRFLWRVVMARVEVHAAIRNSRTTGARRAARSSTGAWTLRGGAYRVQIAGSTSQPKGTR
jgi:N-acetylglucosaminyldiphosphoundecaprenol N-acetyl-beta-D-mannosaminyltransferase